MEFEDFAEPEIAITAAVAAAVFSPRARKVMRKGLVYGVAGVLAAGDVVTSFAKNVGQGVQRASVAATHAAQEKGERGQESRKEAEESGEGRAAEAEEGTSTPRRKTPRAANPKATASAGGY